MKMKELDDLLLFCADRYKQIDCVNSPYTEEYSSTCNNECYNCLFKIHRVFNHDVHYSCERILYRYVLKFQLRYASEAARCFWHVLNDKKPNEPLNIYSLGCGPAPELYGLFAIARYLSFSTDRIEYKGFDIDGKWKVINDVSLNSFNGLKVAFEYTDIFDYINANQVHVNILTLNYVLSDSMRYNKEGTNLLLDNIYGLIVNNHVDYVIINDIALYYLDEQRKSAYACMKDLEKKLTDNHINVAFEKRRYSNPKVAGVEFYGKMAHYNTNMFSVPQAIFAYQPFLICDSIVLIIKKL